MKLTKKQSTKICYMVKTDNDKKIILIDVAGDKTICKEEKLWNIYCTDIDNNVVWQVTEKKTKPPFDNDTFMYLKKSDEGKVVATRFSGFTYNIDPETGEATRIGFHK